MNPIAKFVQDNNIQKLRRNEQTDVSEMYEAIMRVIQNKSQSPEFVKVGTLNEQDIIALGFALKEFYKTFRGSIIIKTTTGKGGVDNVHVNPDTIDYLLHLIEGE